MGCTTPTWDPSVTLGTRQSSMHVTAASDSTPTLGQILRICTCSTPWELQHSLVWGSATVDSSSG